MPAGRHYYFILPALDHPAGGQNVLFRFMRVLQDAGYSVAPVYPDAYHTYQFAAWESPTFYSPRVPQSRGVRHLVRGGMKKAARTLRARTLGGKRNAPVAFGPDAVLVLPEFFYPECVAAFPGVPWVLVAQDAHGLLRAWTRDVETAPAVVGDAAMVIASSQASHDAASLVAAPGRLYRMHNAIDDEGLPFRVEKKQQIAYMPRKRPVDAKIVTSLLRKMPVLEGWDIVRIEKLPQAEVQRIITESLIFLAFSREEGFGLPPAEAMKTGSIVIGYTGVGSTEYFTDETGVTVADGDVIGFARAIADTVAEYRTDPTRLDALRRWAAETINARYTVAQQDAAILHAWARLEADLDAKRAGGAISGGAADPDARTADERAA